MFGHTDFFRRKSYANQEEEDHTTYTSIVLINTTIFLRLHLQKANPLFMKLEILRRSHICTNVIALIHEEEKNKHSLLNWYTCIKLVIAFETALSYGNLTSKDTHKALHPNVVQKNY